MSDWIKALLLQGPPGTTAGGGEQGTATVSPNPLDIGDANSGVVTIENLVTNTNPGAVINLAITGTYSIDKTEIGPLAPGSSDTVTVSVLASGAQTGVLTGDSTDGPISVNVYSSLSYTPATIPGFVDSYDARNITGVSDGAVVPSWPSWGASGAATPDPTYNGATYVANAQNGNAGVQFFGLSAQFVLPAAIRAALAATGEAEVWFVTPGVISAFNAELVGFGTRNATGNAGAYTTGGNPGAVYSNFAITSQQLIGSVPLATYSTPHYGRVYYRSDTGRVGYDIAGAPVGDAAATFGLDATLYLGGNYNNSLFVGGIICEVVIFDRHLDPAEVATMQAYMASAWSV